MLRTFFSIIIPALLCSSVQGQSGSSVEGAYNFEDTAGRHSMIMQDGYFMHAVYDLANKVFKYSEGGTFEVKNDSLIQNIEFSTRAAEKVGERRSFRLQKQNEGMGLTGSGGKPVQWKKVSENFGLTGNWRITGRKQGDNVVQMQRGSRKTLKILSGNRFQWAAINPETKEFFGTGGGTYSFRDGKYTENIEFFSRDNSRVGASLSFNGEVKGNEWHHSGNSSTGSPIYEVWTREK